MRYPSLRVPGGEAGLGGAGGGGGEPPLGCGGLAGSGGRTGSTVGLNEYAYELAMASAMAEPFLVIVSFTFLEMDVLPAFLSEASSKSVTRLVWLAWPTCAVDLDTAFEMEVSGEANSNCLLYCEASLEPLLASVCVTTREMASAWLFGFGLPKRLPCRCCLPARGLFGSLGPLGVRGPLPCGRLGRLGTYVFWSKCS